MLQMSDELESVILKNPTEVALLEVARNQGMFTIKEDALVKAFKREVPIEEVNKL